jgi:oligoendopeptidase F
MENININTLTQRLEDVLTDDINSENLILWLQKWSKLEGEFNEYWVNSFTDKQKDISNSDFKNNWTTFITKFQPAILDISAKIKKKLIDFVQNNEVAIELPFLQMFIDENQINIEKSTEKYVKMMGLAEKIQSRESNLTIQVDDREITYSQYINVISLEERDTREKAWRGLYTKLDEFYVESSRNAVSAISLGNEMANKAGFKDFRSFYWSNKNDLSADNSKKLHLEILNLVTPLKQESTEIKKSILDVNDIFPWDENFDIGKENNIFSEFTESRLIEVVFRRLSENSTLLTELLANLDESLFDISFSPQKTNQAFAAYKPLSRKPLLFMNFRKSFNSFSTFCHELGHTIEFLILTTKNTWVFDYFGSDRFSFTESFAFLFELYVLDILGTGSQALFDAKSISILKFQKALRFIDRMYTCSKREIFEHYIYDKNNNGDFEEYFDSLENLFPSGVNYQGLENQIQKRWIDARSLGAPFTLGLYSRALVSTLLMYKQMRTSGLDSIFSTLALPATLSDKNKLNSLGIEYPFTSTSIESAIAELKQMMIP